MPKQRIVIPPLPPLSFSALQVIEHYETYASTALNRCYTGGFFNKTKAITILRTCIISVFRAKLAYYSTLPNFHQQWIAEIESTTLLSASGMLSGYADDHERIQILLVLQRTIEDHLRDTSQKPKTVSPEKPPSRRKLADLYFAQFPDENIRILDVCWAVGQHYREWKRWLKNEVKDGSTPDLAFRRLLTSGKKPLEFNKKPRPAKWQ